MRLKLPLHTTLAFLFELGHTQVGQIPTKVSSKYEQAFETLPVPPLAMHSLLVWIYLPILLLCDQGSFGVDYNYSSKYEQVILLGIYFVVLVLHCFIKPLGEHNYPEIGIFFWKCPPVLSYILNTLFVMLSTVW